MVDKDEFTYMDTPKFRPKVTQKPMLKPPQIDKQTLEEMRKETPACAGSAARAGDQARGAGAGATTTAAADAASRRLRRRARRRCRRGPTLR